jgi:hypothetical protein
MPIDRLSFAADPVLGDQIRQSAERAGLSISAWLARAAEDRLRNELLGEFLEAVVADTGMPSEQAMREAEAVLDRAEASARSRARKAKPTRTARRKAS